jgi:hypothetical protein
MEIPDLIPFVPQVNPHVEPARRHVDAWVAQFGLIRKEAARRRFARTDFAWFAGATYPTADESDLQLVSDCFAWLFLLDDQLDDGRAGRDLGQVDGMKMSLAAILMGPHRAAAQNPGVGPAPAPLVAALADLWERLDGRTTAAWRKRFFWHVVASATAARWEAENRINASVPDELAYIEARRHTGAIYVCMDLIEVVERLDISAQVHESPLFQDALNSACNVVCWTNDLYSVEKEEALGERHNLVSVVEHHRRLSREQACEHVVQAIASEVQRFIAIEPQLLRAFQAHRDGLVKYLNGMRSWMRGNCDWSKSTTRYRELNTPPEPMEGGYLEPDIFPSPPADKLPG